MDNMALIEMSSMHYINMPKIVSKAHSVSLKFILYCIVRGKKTPILALTEYLQNQTYNVSCQNSVSHILPIYGKTKSMDLCRKNFNLDFVNFVDQVDNVNCVHCTLCRAFKNNIIAMFQN